MTVTHSSVREVSVSDDGNDNILAESLLRLMEWSQASKPLDQALQKICECAAAQSAAIFRVRLETENARALGSVTLNAKAAPRMMSLAAGTLGKTLTSLRSGQVVRMSHVAEHSLLHDVAGAEWMEKNGFCEVGFTQLDRSAHEVDILELYFTKLPEPDWEAQFKDVSKALSRVYKMRRPGTVTDILAKRSQCLASSIPADIAILGLNNPAGLTPAEWRVAVLVSHGLLPKPIAEELGNSITTVRTHLRHIYDKTGLGNFNTLSARLISPVEQQAFQMPLRQSA